MKRSHPSRRAHDGDLRALRMELLRLRGQSERATIVDGLSTLRDGTHRLRAVGAQLGGLGAGVAARSGWIGLAAGLLRRPWAAAFALSALRAVRRRPLLVVAAAAAGLLGYGVLGRRRAPQPHD